MKESYTIPLLSDSIAVSLQTDLLDFYNETKFLLLFFDNPLTVLSTNRFEVINEETIEDYKKNITPKTLLGTDFSLSNTGLLLTDEWGELMSYCDIYTAGYEMAKPESFENGLLSPALQKHIQTIQTRPYDHDLDATDDNFSLMDMFHDISNSINRIKSQTFEMQLWRLELLLAECYQKKIPMVWSNDVDLAACKFYLEFLLAQQQEQFINVKPDADMRHLLGQSLLREVLEFDIINITTIPTNKIIDFKKNNKDLLDNFLSFYSTFLVDLQAAPKDVKKVTAVYSQKLRASLSDIQKELSVLKSTRKHSWLSFISKELFEALKKGLTSGTWSLLGSALSTTGKLIDLGAKGSDLEIQNDDKLRSLIINSSAGYLWKAKEKLGK